MKKILCTRNGSEIRALRKCPGSSCPASHVSCASKVPSNQQGCHWGPSLILVTCLKRKIVSQNKDNSKWKSSVSVNSMEANRHELESPEKRKLNWKKKCFYQIDYRQICRMFSWLVLDKRRGMGDETAKHKTGQAIKTSQKVLFLHGLCFSCSLEVPTLASLDDVL